MFFFVSDEHCHLLTTVGDILLPMVSVLDSGSRGLGSMCFVLGQDTLPMLLSTQEYKWVLVNC